MINRIHIVGASGSGTSTLAQAISEKFGYQHLDTDDYFWQPTEEPFTQTRSVEERIHLLEPDLQKCDRWVLSGSLCGWGDVFISYFDVVLFIWIPEEIRMKRLEQREWQRYGEDIAVGGRRHESYLTFMQWASLYDHAGLEVRSRALHEEWLAALPCQVVRLEGDLSLADKLERIVKLLES